MGFTVQLIVFYKRIFETFDSLPIPRIFAVGSHQIEDASKIVNRFVNLLKKFLENLYEEKNYKTLDPRGVWIMFIQSKSFIWIGSKIPETLKKL